MESIEQKIRDAVLGGEKTIKDVVGFQDAQIEFLYSIAFNLYNQQRYSESGMFFSMLCLCDHRQTRFWLGLGACRQKNGLYNAAVAAYRMAMETGNGDLRAAMHAAECYIAMGLPESAIEVITTTLAEVDGDDPKQHLLGRIDAMRYEIEKQTRSETATVQTV